MTSWLAKHKKEELIRFGSSAQLDLDPSLKKEALVTTLESHLRANPQYAKDSDLSNFYRRAASPVKKANGEARRRRTVTASDDAENSETALIPGTPNALQNLASRIRLPPSPVPAAVARRFEAQRVALARRIGRAMPQGSKVAEEVHGLRRTLSDIYAINLAIVAVEFSGLGSKLLPWEYAFSTPEIKVINVPAVPVWYYKPYALITRAFWTPASLWLLTNILIPLAGSWVFNQTFTRPPPSRPRMRSVKSVEPLREFDPLTFSIVKGLMVWLVYAQGFRFWGSYADVTAMLVDDAVYGGYVGMLIAAGVGILTSLHDNLSFK